MKYAQLSVLVLLITGCASTKTIPPQSPTKSPVEVARMAVNNGTKWLAQFINHSEHDESFNLNSHIKVQGLRTYKSVFFTEEQENIRRALYDHCQGAGGDLVYNTHIGDLCQLKDGKYLYSYQMRGTGNANRDGAEYQFSLYYVPYWNFTDPGYIKLASKTLHELEEKVIAVKEDNMEFERQKAREYFISEIKNYALQMRNFERKKPLLHTPGTQVCLRVNGSIVRGFSKGRLNNVDETIGIHINSIDGLYPVRYRNLNLIPGVDIVDTGLYWDICN
ncbi:hypothetical protein Ppb6_04138 [Photorhabdus australis subsp. thailandensis]|uniref:Lipoprotein n=1 Tax=Photorhabdus australis subsp. thailandensis TaxID=2805096 RepID=A0A1C0TZD4_9GAMM|nr:hypothetical protein [Photorhabdus australis]OCQ51040.1 hypothetical protein Ppb6_04138 [Photorhabdus australis subsp. thailandensis]